MWDQDDRQKVCVLVVPWGWEWEVTNDGHQVSLGADGNVWQIHCDDGHMTL